ncbi:MAG TPA: alkaline phosphatase D family protein, partial [Opitutaceae bacterium]|nr:alkaline phosphatase D family protein [Opitutaceae bacterium]
LSVRLVLSRNADLSAPSYFGPVTTQTATGNMAKIDATGLLPATTYYYAFEVSGVLRAETAARGSFRTFPLGAASFKLAFASCGDFHATNQTAYDAILAEQPAVFIHMGDFHYSDINSTNVADYRANYDSVLNQPNEAALYRGVALAYMWDDHDYCGNGSDTTSVGRDTARQAYHETVPHYPLAATAGGTLSQAFTIGRVRVIMTDLRSGADPRGQADTAAKSHLSAAQKAWFKQELISARDAGFPLILWVCTNPWIGAAGSGDDDWSVFATERRELANFIRDNSIRNLVLLSGDMHALAYDDGTHSDYADGGGAPMVVLHAAALTSNGSTKGGPYTGGPVPGSQQYGILEVTDNGGPLHRQAGRRGGEAHVRLRGDERVESGLCRGGAERADQHLGPRPHRDGDGQQHRRLRHQWLGTSEHPHSGGGAEPDAVRRRRRPAGPGVQALPGTDGAGGERQLGRRRGHAGRHVHARRGVRLWRLDQQGRRGHGDPGAGCLLGGGDECGRRDGHGAGGSLRRPVASGRPGPACIAGLHRRVRGSLFGADARASNTLRE